MAMITVWLVKQTWTSSIQCFSDTGWDEYEEHMLDHRVRDAYVQRWRHQPPVPKRYAAMVNGQCEARVSSWWRTFYGAFYPWRYRAEEES